MKVSSAVGTLERMTMSEKEKDAAISEIERRIQLQQVLIKVSLNPAEFISILQDSHHLGRLQEFLDCSQEIAEQVLHRMTVDVFTGPRRRKAEHDLIHLEQRLGELRT